MANSIWQETIQDNARNNVAGAQIDVFDEVTGLRATIFSTLGGASLTNPFFADAEGFAVYYAGPGTYRVVATDTGTGQTKTHRYIRLGDAASRDSGLGTDELPDSDNLNMVSAVNNFTSNNLNPNVFGGQDANDVIVQGLAVNSTTAIFKLPISTVNGPSSITINGTFNVSDEVTGVAVGGGSGVSAFSLELVSSSKIAVLAINGLSVTTDQRLIIRIVTSASKITVNP
jgi:hypothetical protein